MKWIIPIAAAVIFMFSCKKKDTPVSPVQTFYDSGYHTLSGGLALVGNPAIATSDNNIAICGMRNGKALLAKINRNGSLVWLKDYITDPGSEITSVAEKPGGGFVISGNDGRRTFLIGTNASGQRLWKNYYGTQGATTGHQVIYTSDGYFVLAGHAYKDTTATTLADIYLAKIKTDGSLLWERTYPTATGELCYNIIETSSGDLLVTGSMENNGYASGMYILRLLASGEPAWEIQPAANETAIAVRSVELPGNDIITCSHNISGGYSSIAVTKYDAAGNKLWANSISEPGMHLAPFSIVANNDGTVVITGNIYSTSSASADILIAKVDGSGNKLWMKKAGGTADDKALGIIPNGDGFIVIGNTMSYGDKPENGNIFLLKTTSAGDIIY